MDAIINQCPIYKSIFLKDPIIIVAILQRWHNIEERN